MKKFKFIFLFCFLFVLCGCNKTLEEPQHEKINYYEQKIEDNDLIQAIMQEETHQATTYYYGNLNLFYTCFTFEKDNYSFYEGTISEKSEIICGYIPKKTFEKIDENRTAYIEDSSIDLSSGMAFNGIDYHSFFYFAALKAGKMDEEDQVYLFTFEDSIPAEFNDLKLLFVIEEVEISLTNGITKKVLNSQRGKIENNLFVFPEWNLSDKFRGNTYFFTQYKEENQSPYIWLLYFSMSSLQIEQYNNKEAIAYSWSLPEVEGTTKFLETFGSLIVSENIGTSTTDRYYFDYDGIKEIFNLN